MTIREITSADGPFLVEMLDAALFWRPKRSREPVQAAKRAVMRLIAKPILAKYHRAWGRTGDTGFIAVVGGVPVGAAWYRFFTKADHGDGFVDERTPELVIAVRDGHRGRGVGRTLMIRLAEQASRDGVARISLSADRDNPARRLYASLGYTDYGLDEKEDRMVLDVAAHDPRHARA